MLSVKPDEVDEIRQPLAFRNDQGRMFRYSAVLNKQAKKMKLTPVYDEDEVKAAFAKPAKAKATPTRREKVQAAKADTDTTGE